MTKSETTRAGLRNRVLSEFALGRSQQKLLKSSIKVIVQKGGKVQGIKGVKTEVLKT